MAPAPPGPPTLSGQPVPAATSATSERPSWRDRAPLKPREHGAYAMVTFPLLSGLLVGGWSVAGAAFAALVVTAFLAYESVNVLTGGRGARVQAASGARARRSLVPLGGVALVAGVVFVVAALAGMAGADGVQSAATGGLAGRLAGVPTALVASTVPAALGAVVLALALAGRVKTLPGELFVAAAFASTHLPVAAAGGATGRALWIPSLVWLAGFTLATLTVHSLKYRFRGRGPGRWTVPLTPWLATAVVLAGFAVPVLEPALVAVAALVPVAAMPLGLSLVRVHPRNLKRIGWTLVGVDTLTLVLLALLLG